MKKRIMIVLVLLVVSVVAFKVYLDHRIPDDIETKGTVEITAMVSLITAIVSLITAIVTLIMTIRQKGA